MTCEDVITRGALKGLIVKVRHIITIVMNGARFHRLGRLKVLGKEQAYK